MEPKPDKEPRAEPRPHAPQLPRLENKPPLVRSQVGKTALLRGRFAVLELQDQQVGEELLRQIGQTGPPRPAEGTSRPEAPAPGRPGSQAWPLAPRERHRSPELRGGWLEGGADARPRRSLRCSSRGLHAAPCPVSFVFTNVCLSFFSLAPTSLRVHLKRGRGVRGHRQPERARPRLTSQATPRRAWLVLGWEAT